MRLILAEQFFSVLYKADNNHHGGAYHAREKQNLEKPHCEDRYRHASIVYRLELAGVWYLDLERLRSSCPVRYTRPCMNPASAMRFSPGRIAPGGVAWTRWAAAVLSAALLELPFPLAGPLPPWRAVFAWFGLVPLIWAVLSLPDGRRALRQAFFIAYLCGVLWYMGNCYWIYATMHIYGDLPPVTSVLLLAGFSLVLGLYFGLFGWGLASVRQKTGSGHMALVFAPFLWTALDLAAARITSVPWDQLGYSQVDNQAITPLAPWTGVYGITFLLVAANALIAEDVLSAAAPSTAG